PGVHERQPHGGLPGKPRKLCIRTHGLIVFADYTRGLAKSPLSIYLVLMNIKGSVTGSGAYFSGKHGAFSSISSKNRCFLTVILMFQDLIPKFRRFLTLEKKSDESH
ncbi:hypothetical protein, partial [Rhizobium alvei]